MHFSRVSVTGFGDHIIDEILQCAGNNHHNTHNEYPHEQLNLYYRVCDGQDDKGNQGNAGYAVGLETVRARAD